LCSALDYYRNRIDMTLNELALKYGSDKSSEGHNYMPFYEKHLPKNPKSILEVGVLKGASIEIWRNYFPDTFIYGLDLFNEFPIPQIDNVKFFRGSQLDEHILYDIRNNVRPEIIIEDASHNCASHWVTLMSLIGTCKLYFIEDLHTCRDEFYRQDLKFEQTVLGAMLSGKFPFEFELSESQEIAVIKNI